MVGSLVERTKEPMKKALSDAGLAAKDIDEVVLVGGMTRMPRVREFVKEGALMSYGPDVLDIFRRSADYVDGILKGQNPAEMPVQPPAKFETAINVKTAKAMGLTVPPALLVSADEVVQ